jgi:Lar family restriction alleviation protein
MSDQGAIDDKLKPCPFCGGKAKHMTIEPDENMRSGYFVYCLNCECATPVVPLPVNAVDIWNRRV